MSSMALNPIQRTYKNMVMKTGIKLLIDLLPRDLRVLEMHIDPRRFPSYAPVSKPPKFNVDAFRRKRLSMVMRMLGNR